MTATIVRIDEVIEHPNADNLTIYKVSDGLSVKIRQVVANQKNVYKKGDHAVYIHPNSILLDGTKIKERKLRDVLSYGMLAGHSDLDVGMNVTEHWCQEEKKWHVSKTNLTHKKWPSIQSFPHVKKHVENNVEKGLFGQFHYMKYGGKVKLHGVYAGVQVTPLEEVVAQKGNGFIYPNNDYYGFAKWVQENEDSFKKVSSEYNLIIHGEWFGPNIQKGAACSLIPEMKFAVFALELKTPKRSTYYLEPFQIERMIGKLGPWYILPWEHEIFIDFTDDLRFSVAATEINEKVLKVEACDPFIKKNFGIEGVGEGLVYFPMFEDLTGVYSDAVRPFIFKAKSKQ